VNLFGNVEVGMTLAVLVGSTLSSGRSWSSHQQTDSNDEAAFPAHIVASGKFSEPVFDRA
jgi:hypothetical protein